MTRFNTALFAALAIAAMMGRTRPAAAIEYPCCVQYGDMDGDGGRNCGFVSYQQCMETARGSGGFCEHNLFYTDAPERPAKPARKRQND
jgi:hypothetical protein